MTNREYTSERYERVEIEKVIDGEKFIFRPKKKSEAFLNLLSVDRNDDMKTLSYSQAQMEFVEDCLDRAHRPNLRKKHPGHGQESIEGCQACRLYDCLNDDDHPMELETILRVASDLVGEMSERPTGPRGD